MARIISNADFPNLTGFRKHSTYNGIDECVTREILDGSDGILHKLTSAAWECYGFERGMQNAAFTMMLRGVRIDEAARVKEVGELEKVEAGYEADLQDHTKDVWDILEKRKGKCADGKLHKWPRDDTPDNKATCGKCGRSRLVAAHINPRSQKQVLKLCYERLGMKVELGRKSKKPAVDDEILDRLINKYPQHRPILECIQNARTVRKQIGLLKSRISVDGRWRASFNVGAAETDRWSSSKSPKGEGTNFQNIADRSRHVIVADPGMMLGYADLEQAESNVVAHDAQDENYIAAHKSGDVHTFVAKLVWPEMPWPGNPKDDRALCEEPAPWDKYHELRWYSKHQQHGTNIGMTPHGIARDAHIPLKQAQEGQERYFRAFPGIQQRQREIEAEVRRTGELVTPLGRVRKFFGRVWEASTLREAKAQTQQCMVAWILNMALWQVWRDLDLQVNTVVNNPKLSDPNRVWILAQEHDAILFEFRAGDYGAIEEVKKRMVVPCQIHGRTMVIETDVKVGNNFRKFDRKKLETVGGLAKYKVVDGKMLVYNTVEDLQT